MIEYSNRSRNRVNLGSVALQMWVCVSLINFQPKQTKKMCHQQHKSVIFWTHLGDSLAQTSPMIQAMVGRTLNSINLCQLLQCSLLSRTVCSPSLGIVKWAKVLVNNPPNGQNECSNPVYLVRVPLGQVSDK